MSSLEERGRFNVKCQPFQLWESVFGVNYWCVINLETSETKIVGLSAQKQQQQKKNNRKNEAFKHTVLLAVTTQAILWHLLSSVRLVSPSGFIWDIICLQTAAQHGELHRGTSRRLLSTHLLPGGVHRHPSLIPTFNPRHLLLHPHFCLPAQPQGLGGHF